MAQTNAPFTRAGRLADSTAQHSTAQHSTHLDLDHIRLKHRSTIETTAICIPVGAKHAAALSARIFYLPATAPLYAPPLYRITFSVLELHVSSTIMYSSISRFERFLGSPVAKRHMFNVKVGVAGRQAGAVA